MSRRNDRNQRKKKERERRIRQQKHLSRAGPDVYEIELPSEIALERALWERSRPWLPWLFSALPKWLGGGSEKARRDQAQRLAYDAWEAETAPGAVELARQALAIDPDCVDAFHILALNAGSPQEKITLLQQAVAAGERDPGFARNKGNFWRVVETRPYMRARRALADLFRSQGRLAEAIDHYRALLELNPDDNQGVRESLLGACFEVDDLEGVRQVLCRYPGDFNIVSVWARVLERFLSGDLVEAGGALQEARERNPHVQAYLTGKKRLPSYLPVVFILGDESEAFPCVMELGNAWQRYPEAVAWLRAQR